MRRTRIVGAMAAIVALAPVEARAADLPPQRGNAQCVGDFRSGLLDLPRPEVNDSVTRMYEHARDVSQQDRVVAGTSSVFTWSSEAKVACAKAVGFLKSNDMNGPQISQCDCFYGRMQMAIDLAN